MVMGRPLHGVFGPLEGQEVTWALMTCRPSLLSQSLSWLVCV